MSSLITRSFSAHLGTDEKITVKFKKWQPNNPLMIAFMWLTLIINEHKTHMHAHPVGMPFLACFFSTKTSRKWTSVWYDRITEKSWIHFSQPGSYNCAFSTKRSLSIEHNLLHTIHNIVDNFRQTNKFYFQKLIFFLLECISQFEKTGGSEPHIFVGGCLILI